MGEQLQGGTAGVASSIGNAWPVSATTTSKRCSQISKRCSQIPGQQARGHTNENGQDDRHDDQHSSLGPPDHAGGQVATARRRALEMGPRRLPLVMKVLGKPQSAINPECNQRGQSFVFLYQVLPFGGSTWHAPRGRSSERLNVADCGHRGHLQLQSVA